MKKPLVFVAAACACALALHADFNYSNVFKAIGPSASGTNNLNSTNGSWSSFAGDVGEITWEDGSLVFDLEDNQSIAFSVTDGVAPDTNTVVKVEVKGVFSPVNTNDFPSGAEMTTRSAQLGFVIGINTAANTTNYYAWAGGDSWVLLSHPEGAEPNVTDETDLIATFNYNGTHAVQFDIVRGNTTNSLNNGVALSLTSAAGAVAGNVAGISCYGSGKLKSADGSVGLGYADVGGVKYGSLADANAAAAGSGGTITVLRSTTESVTLSNGVSISDPNQLASGATIAVASGDAVNVVATSNEVNNGVSGPCSIPLNISALSADQINVTLPGTIDDNKEIVGKDISGSSMTFTLQTKTSVLEATNPGGDKALSANIANLRTFLSSYTNAAYIAADVSHSTLEAALQASGDNGIPLYQSYALGIAPTDSIAPVTAPAGDPSTTQITLAIPAIVTNNYSGDYTVTYQAVGETSGASTADPQSIAVPLGTGTYTIKATLTPAQ